MNRAWILGAGVAALVAGVYALNAQVVPQPGPPVAIACAFNTVRPTLNTGQAGWVQCDNAGQLLVSGGGGGGGSVTQGTVPWVVDTVASGGNLIDAINSPIPTQAPTVNIGAVGISQTTDGTTNAVRLLAETTKVIGTVRNTDGTGNNINADPCERAQQASTPISITTATTTRIVAPSASNKTYICYLFLTSAAADNVGIVEGTGGTCGSGTAGVVGGSTAANGPNFAANSGVALSAGGKVAAAVTAGTNVDLCLITSAATPLAGVIKWVQAP